MKEYLVVIADTGEVRFIYDDDLISVSRQLGAGYTKRASNVDPGQDDMWYADLSPVGGPLLGPYDKRATAIDAEVAWLEENNIPEPLKNAK